MATVSESSGQAKSDVSSEEPLTLESAFALFQSELLGALVCLVGNYEDARDALQESFIKCWRHQEQVPRVHNLKAWIFRITLNTGRDIRQTAWRRRRQSLGDGSEQLPASTPSPLNDAAAAEEMDRLRCAIGALRSEEQEIFLLRQNADLTYEQIGVELDLPTGTVKTRMRMAVAHLRELVQTSPAEPSEPSGKSGGKH